MKTPTTPQATEREEVMERLEELRYTTEKNAHKGDHGTFTANRYGVRQLIEQIKDYMRSIEAQLTDLQKENKELLEAKHDADSRHKQEFKRGEELKEELSWIQDIADSDSYGEGGETPEVRLNKIKMICDDILNPSYKGRKCKGCDNVTLMSIPHREYCMECEEDIFASRNSQISQEDFYDIQNVQSDYVNHDSSPVVPDDAREKTNYNPLPFIKRAIRYWQIERLHSRLIDVNGIVWYTENDEKIDEIEQLLYPL